MTGDSLGLTLAFTAGLVSFISPCCLPLVPTYVTYLTGSSFEELTEGSMNTALKRRVMINALAFILGFSAVFIALGLTASSVGHVLRENMSLVRQVSGIVVVAFGLHMMGFFHLPFLEREMKAQVLPGAVSFRNSMLIGAAFSAGWSPCVGPVLTAILFMAAQSQSAAQGGLLLASYSLGLAVPFFLTALSLGWFIKFMPRIGRYLPRIRWASGALMVVVGLMIYTNAFITINRYFNWTGSLGL